MAQESRLREVQVMLQLKERENRKIKKMIEELKKKYEEEEERRLKEFENEQWTFLPPSEASGIQDRNEFEFEQGTFGKKGSCGRC